jgi:hypothetical protein
MSAHTDTETETEIETETSPETSQRSPSDCGRVFPSGVKIGKTSYGLGVFAYAFIPKGTPVARLSGKMICDPDYGSDYCVGAGEGKVLEPAPPFCYLNHSCEPNCQLLQYVREDELAQDDPLETGGLTEDEMNLDDESMDWVEDDEECYYGGETECEEEFEEEIEPEESEEDADDVADPVFDDEAELWVETIHDIFPDEELTIDYAWPADRKAKCLCGKPNCRGWIVDPDELHLLTQDG